VQRTKAKEGAEKRKHPNITWVEQSEQKKKKSQPKKRAEGTEQRRGGAQKEGLCRDNTVLIELRSVEKVQQEREVRRA